MKSAFMHWANLEATRDGLAHTCTLEAVRAQSILDTRISRHSSRLLSRAGEHVSYALNHCLPPSHAAQ